MNRGIQRGLGLETLRGVNANQPNPRPAPTLTNSGTPQWQPTYPATPTTNTHNAGNLFVSRYYIEPGCTLVGLGCVVTGVASATLRFGVYSETVMGLPGTLLLDTQQLVDASTTGFKSTAFSLAEDGWVWLGVAVQGGNGQVYSVVSGGDLTCLPTSVPATVIGAGGYYLLGGCTGALPNPFGAVVEWYRPPAFLVDVRPF